MEKAVEKAMEIEKERNAAITDEQIRLFGERKVTDVQLKLNCKNKACFKAVGNKAFKASQFVRYDGAGMWMKRPQDADETFIRNSWVKNIEDVIKYIEG